MKHKYLVVIAGPTAIGKTSLSIALAKDFNSCIVSADSRQVFKEMKIGTSVPSDEELHIVKHFFIQSVSIGEKYNASKYETEVLQQLEESFKQYSLIFLTGGSGLYIDAVCRGIDDFPDTNQELRENLFKKLEVEGIESLRHDLKLLDPLTYSRIDLNNPKRIQKALEICLMTGKPYSSFLSGTAKKRPFRVIRIGLDMPREQLYERINARTLKMMEEGFEEEARKLFPLRHNNSLNTVGYKEMFAYFEGKSSLLEAIEKIQANTRKYARKQLTWFRKHNEYTWFNPENKEGIKRFILQKMEEDNE
jgi:tRNA dimethylallyltransferase